MPFSSVIVRLMIHSLQTCVKLMIFLTHPQSIFQQWRLSSPRLPLWSDCKTLTALSRLFVSRRGFFAVLEVYKVPQGQGTLNTDRMCGASEAHQPHPHHPGWLNWGLGGFSGGLDAGEGGVRRGVIGVITHKQTAYASHQCSNTLPH